MFRFSIIGLALFFCVGAAFGADGGEVVVVTGSRLSDYDRVPHVNLPKRADHLITKVRVTCDTRDAAIRRAEIKRTLSDMIRAAAQTKTISLAHGDEVLFDLNERAFDDLIAADKRADTSEALVIIKAAVSQSDSFESATARIKQFIASAPKAGRTEILREERWDLTLVAPERYRDELIRLIVADAKRTAELIGPQHGVAIEGLQNPVAWYQRGPLDLGLYISYTLNVAPLPGGK